MVLDWQEWNRDNPNIIPKIHPTQKPVNVLKRLIEIFTDVVIDPVAGSGSTLRAAMELGRSAFGFEIDRKIHAKAKAEMLNDVKVQSSIMEFIESVKQS